MEYINQNKASVHNLGLNKCIKESPCVIRFQRRKRKNTVSWSAQKEMRSLIAFEKWRSEWSWSDSWVELSELTGPFYSPPLSIIWWPRGRCGGGSPMTQSLNSSIFSDPAETFPFSDHHTGLLSASCVFSSSLLCFSHVESHFCAFAKCYFLSLWCPSWLLVCLSNIYFPAFSSRIISLLAFVSSPFLCTSSFLPFRVGQSLFLL